jgi:hypothetical protein
VQRVEYQEVVEQERVQVCRYVNETRAVQVPKTVPKWVQTTSMRLVPRTVTMRVPLDGYGAPIVIPPAPGYAAPATGFAAPATGYGTPAYGAPPPQAPRVPADTAPRIDARRPVTNGQPRTNGTPNGQRADAQRQPEETPMPPTPEPDPEEVPMSPRRNGIIEAVPRDPPAEQDENRENENGEQGESRQNGAGGEGPSLRPPANNTSRVDRHA